MELFKIYPPMRKDPVAYNFIEGTFLPRQAIFNELELYTYAPFILRDSIKNVDGLLTYSKTNGTYYGTGYTEDELNAKITLKEALKNDRLRKQYYVAYIVNRNTMYDIDASDNPNDYAKFLYENPILVESVNQLARFPATIAPDTFIEGLEEIAAFMMQLKNLYANKKESAIPYYKIKNLHLELIKVLEAMDEMRCSIEIYYESARLTDIHARDHIVIQNVNFDNLYVDWDIDDSEGYEYPIIGIDQCKIKESIIVNSVVRQLVVKWSEIGSISKGYPILGIHLDTVNVNQEPIELPNCGQTIYLSVIDTTIDPKHYKEMISFSKKNVVKIFTMDSFIKQYLKYFPSAKADRLPFFIADYRSSQETTRFDRTKDKFDCDAFIITDDPKVLALKYEKIYQNYKDLPRDMMELLAGILSK